MTRPQYGISALVSQTSFRGETSGGVAKYRLFSKAKTHVTIQAVVTELNARLAIRQRADLLEANISGNKIIQNYCQSCIRFCFNSHFKWRLAIASLHQRSSGKKKPVVFIYSLSGPLHSRFLLSYCSQWRKVTENRWASSHVISKRLLISVQQAYVLNNHKARRFKNTFLTIN